MKPFASLALLLALAPLPAAAEAPAAPERTVEAAKIFPFLDKFYAASPAERSLLSLRYNLTHDGKPASDVHLFLVLGGKRTPIPVSADGRIERLPTPTELAQHAQVAIEAPQGVKFNNRLNLESAVKPALEVSAADCATSIAQANAAIQRAAGMMAMLDGKTQPLPMVKGAPSYDPASIKGAKTIRLAKAPSVVSLD
jgi:hypothetical protein